MRHFQLSVFGEDLFGEDLNLVQYLRILLLVEVLIQPCFEDIEDPD